MPHYHLEKTHFFLFFLFEFFLWTFTIHGTAGEGRKYLFNASLPLPLASEEFRH